MGKDYREALGGDPSTHISTPLFVAFRCTHDSLEVMVASV